ncbi:MAG: hemerythrin family protein [Gallionella sp.]|nr:hemerythrin family protein [Gallionella sp.]
MMKLAWTKQLSVGNAVIDSDHKNLIGMVNNVRNAIRSRNSIYLPQAFWQLEHWLCVHYANEERIAHAVNFDFSGHKQDQQYELVELQHLRDELVAKSGIWSDGAVKHFTDFLKNLMIDDHIVKRDMLMKPTLQAYDYETLSGSVWWRS